MKKLIILLMFNVLAYSQTINFKACPNLFENTTYVFNKISTDTSGRNIYQTTPIDGAQACGGLGICEFQISWKASSNRWELIADDGSGNFSTPHLIYYNTSASLPNPPSLNLGIWQENTTVTMGTCGGNLSTSNSILTGAVQDTTLGTESANKNGFILLSNPVKDEINLLSPTSETAYLYDFQGKLAKTVTLINGQNSLDVSELTTGVYILKTSSETVKIIKK